MAVVFVLFVVPEDQVEEAEVDTELMEALFCNDDDGEDKLGKEEDDDGDDAAARRPCISSSYSASFFPAIVVRKDPRL